MPARCAVIKRELSCRIPINFRDSTGTLLIFIMKTSDAVFPVHFNLCQCREGGRVIGWNQILEFQAADFLLFKMELLFRSCFLQIDVH
mgnify:CR=1 FL=1